MGEISLFKITSGKASEILGKTAGVEKTLQVLLEKNLESTLGVRFLQSEYSTGKIHAGRIDTLGIDENDCPTIIEYKRSTNENVINQGLYYLDWLLDHKAEFELLVTNKLGKPAGEKIDWSSPRLICIAGDFTKFDGHAVRQIERNIDLVRYRYFGDDLLILELAHRSSPTEIAEDNGKGKKQSHDKTVAQNLAEISPEMSSLLESLRSFVLALGEDIEEKHLKLYIVFRTIKNFVCVVIQKKALLVYVNTSLVPGTGYALEKGFSRDVSDIGHWGTGNWELTITDQVSLQKAQEIILMAYLVG